MGDNFVESEIFFGELFERLGGSEELSLHENFIIYFEIRYKRMLCINKLLVVLLDYRDFSFEYTFQFIETDSKVTGLGRSNITLREY